MLVTNSQVPSVYIKVDSKILSRNGIRNYPIMKINFLTLVFLLSTLSNIYGKSNHYDICVYGETASGVMAAIQSARMGKSVVLLCKSTHVGGVATSGLTATDMNRNQLVGGIAREFYGKIFQYYLDPKAWKSQDRTSYMQSTLKRTYTGKNDDLQIQWVYESSVAEKIMLEMLKTEGVNVLFNHRLNLKKKVSMDGNRIISIELENKKIIQANMFIDATYEGDLMAKANVTYVVGRESNLTYDETLNGIKVNAKQDPILEKVNPYIIEGNIASGLLPYIDSTIWGEEGSADKRIQAYCYRVTLTDDPKNKIQIEKPKDYNASLYEILVRKITLQPTIKLQQIITLTPMPNRKTDTNHLDFVGGSYLYPEADYAEREQIELKHKSFAMGMLWLLGNDPRIPEQIRMEMKAWGLPKDEFKDTKHFPSQIYVREARRMVGPFVMSEKNVRKKDRAIALNSVGLGTYTMDCHFVSRMLDNAGKLQIEGSIFESTTPYPISYYSLIPKEKDCGNLLVSICLSASHVAYTSIRMEPVYMILGQSAATAACIAIDQNSSVQNIDYQKLRQRLLSDNQIITFNQK